MNQLIEADMKALAIEKKQQEQNDREAFQLMDDDPNKDQHLEEMIRDSNMLREQQQEEEKQSQKQD